MSSPGQDGERRVGGRYTLSAELGSGAMGTVWRGWDEVLRRAVAIKELKVPLGIPEREALAMRERMLREARALGGLSNPHVITVYDVVDVDGAPLVVLEMLPSRNLATMIGDQGRLNAQQAAVVGYATAGALRAAHRAGITHRDVKPGNVLVADDGRVKLTDFGIARNSADAPMTTAGLVLGSPAYIAPEVAAGAPVTPAADLWGLGATLFAAIEGRPPYDVRGDPVSTITEVVDGDVPRPRDAGPVSAVIAALMVKDPLQRMPLEEVRNRLRPLIPDPDDPLYPGSPDSPTLAAMAAPVRPPEAPPGEAADPSAVSASALNPLPRPRVSASGPVPTAGSAPLALSPGSIPGLRLPLDGTGNTPLHATGAAPVHATGARLTPAPEGTGQVPAAPPRPGLALAPRRTGRATATREMPSWWAAPLVVAGALVVLLGAAGAGPRSARSPGSRRCRRSPSPPTGRRWSRTTTRWASPSTSRRAGRSTATRPPTRRACGSSAPTAPRSSGCRRPRAPRRCSAGSPPTSWASTVSAPIPRARSRARRRGCSRRSTARRRAPRSARRGCGSSRRPTVCGRCG
ncbi:protein kinase [Pseudonocardia benzenivorans]